MTENTPERKGEKEKRSTGADPLFPSAPFPLCLSPRPLSPRTAEWAKQRLSALLSDVMRLELRRLYAENLLIGRRSEIEEIMARAPVWQTTVQGE